MSHAYIIDHTENLRLHHRVTEVGLTLLFWGALVYMWQPLIAMLAWLFKIKLFYDQMILLEGYKVFLELLAFYAMMVACLSLSLLIWAKINQWRFQGKDKRKASPAVTLEQLKTTANGYGMPASGLMALQSSACAWIEFDDKGQVCGDWNLNDNSDGTD